MNSLNSDIQNLKVKWQSGSELTPKMNDLITQLAEELDLEALTAFNLIDGYFSQHPNRYHYVTQLESNIA